MSDVTEETYEDRKARYMSGDPYFCLYCAERTVWGGHIESFEEYGYRLVTCSNCMRQWKEVFDIIDIDEIEVNENDD